MTKKFVDYYQCEEYKERHLAYMKTSVPCKICGKMVQRSNMTAHNKTAKEHRNLLVVNMDKLDAIQKDVILKTLEDNNKIVVDLSHMLTGN